MWPFRRKKHTPHTGMNVDTPTGQALRRHFKATDQLQNAPKSKQFELAMRFVTFSNESARAFREDGWDDFPNHHGFQRIAINLERSGSYADAIDICRRAKKEGWNGDWEKRIERLEVKQSKS